MLALLQLLRWPNLLLLCLTQWTLWQAIALPVSRDAADQWQFWAICLATCCITAAGYIINDIMDLSIDQINKPDKVLLGHKISFRLAWGLYIGLQLLALALGVWLGDLPLLLLFVATGFLLWIYSKYLKMMPLWGNLLVASLVALVVAELMYWQWTDLQGRSLLIYGSYLSFAFWTTLLRELVKDAEDMEGDAALGGRSFPIVMGLPATRALLLAMASTLFISLLLTAYNLQQLLNLWGLLYLFIGLMLPVCVGMYFIIQAKYKKDFARLSALLKLYMLLGLGWLWLLKFLGTDLL